MDFISSDTNVWIDFAIIDRLHLAFKLPYTYLMNSETIENEVLHPPGLSKRLLELGLQPTELNTEEYFLAEELNQKYSKPSIYDCIALSIAISRGLPLLSGDGPLRKAAEKEGVKVIGTLGIFDELLCGKLIDTEEYLHCMYKLKEHNNGRIRLPALLIEERIKKAEKALNLTE